MLEDYPQNGPYQAAVSPPVGVAVVLWAAVLRYELVIHAAVMDDGANGQNDPIHIFSAALYRDEAQANPSELRARFSA
jgi:hypothetical protein